MRTLDKYRFSLQWGVETAEKFQAGEFLESLGNKKSEFVVLAVTDYIAAHPEVFSSGHKLQIVVKPNFTREQLEAMISAIMEIENAAGSLSTQESDSGGEAAAATGDAGLAAMLENLDLFL